MLSAPRECGLSVTLAGCFPRGHGLTPTGGCGMRGGAARAAVGGADGVAVGREEGGAGGGGRG